jgi:hypothetical protein
MGTSLVKLVLSQRKSASSSVRGPDVCPFQLYISIFEHATTRTSPEQEIERVIKLYTIGGFHVKFILVDIQFKAIKDRGIIPTIVNVVGKGEHVPVVERFIRVVKGRSRCNYAMLPFDVLPKIMVMHLLTTVMFYNNSFVWRKGVSQYLTGFCFFWGYIFFGAYFPQKLTPKTSTEPQYKLFQRHVPFYILKRSPV